MQTTHIFVLYLGGLKINRYAIYMDKGKKTMYNNDFECFQTFYLAEILFDLSHQILKGK